MMDYAVQIVDANVRKIWVAAPTSDEQLARRARKMEVRYGKVDKENKISEQVWLIIGPEVARQDLWSRTKKRRRGAVGRVAGVFSWVANEERVQSTGGGG